MCVCVGGGGGGRWVGRYVGAVVWFLVTFLGYSVAILMLGTIELVALL